MRVLLIEDEARLARTIARVLESEHFDVDVALDGETGLDMALTGSYDIAVVDRLLPKLDGIQIVERVRDEALDLPVLMLTALSDVPERVEGLNAGADDYLGKPFSFDELIARIRALARRGDRPVRPRTLKVGRLEIDLTAHSVSSGGEVVDLTAQEFRVLEVLARNHGRVVTRDELLERAWGPEADPAGNVVELYIHYLRRKLKQGGGDAVIQTVRGVGYLMPKA